MASPQQKSDLQKLQEATRLMNEAQKLLNQLSAPARREHNSIIGYEMLSLAVERFENMRGLAHFGVHGKSEEPS